MKGETGILSDFIAGLTYEDIPPEVTRTAVRLILDTVGCMYSGSTAAGIREVLQYVSEFDKAGDAGLFGYGRKLGIHNAALVNAAAAHARDYDDTHDEAVNHASVTILPAITALSQYLSGSVISRKNRYGNSGIDTVRPVSGKEFITAFCAGLETANRISLAFIPYLSVGWLPTTLSGPFGSACAASRLLGLSADGVSKAVGFAYTQAHGNRQALIEGTLAKRIQPAFSSVAGLHSAFLAQKGLTSPKNIFTGDYGIANLYTDGKIDAGRLTSELGNEWETGRISIKPYPSCRCTHPVIDAALRLKSEHVIDYRDITKGVIFLPPVSMGQIGQRFTIGMNPTVDAQFSAQYAAAVSFVNGRPSLPDFEPEAITGRQEIYKLANCFIVKEYEHDNRGLVPVEIRITMMDGTIHQARVETITGSREQPVPDELLLEKFRENLSYASVPDTKIQKVANTLLSIEAVEDTGTMFRDIQEETTNE